MDGNEFRKTIVEKEESIRLEYYALYTESNKWLWEHKDKKDTIEYVLITALNALAEEKCNTVCYRMNLMG